MFCPWMNAARRTNSKWMAGRLRANQRVTPLSARELVSGSGGVTGGDRIRHQRGKVRRRDSVLGDVPLTESPEFGRFSHSVSKPPMQ